MDLGLFCMMAVFSLMKINVDDYLQYDFQEFCYIRC